MKRRIMLVTLAGLMLLAAAAIADDASKTAGTAATGAKTAATPATPSADAAAGEHKTFLPADFKWVDAPPALPKGSKVFVMHGDMNAPGMFAIRAWIPAGYKIPPHWHPANENVTVISGALYMGMGETWDEAKGQAMPAGSFSVMPAGMKHFAWTNVETVIQIHAMGPWGITYVNPQDDPRNAKQATK